MEDRQSPGAGWTPGSGNDGSRTSALWGKRSGGLVRMLVLAVAVAFLVPMAAMAKQPSSSLPATFVNPALLQAAQADPAAAFDVIVTADGKLQKTIAQALSDARAQRPGRAKGGKAKFKVINGASAQLTGAQISLLATASGLTITPDVKVEKTSFSNDQLWDESAQFDLAASPASAPTIAVVDSGVEARGDFGPRLLAQVDLYSGTGANSAGDGRGHGTMVAGIAAGSADGHAGASPTSNIVSLDVLGDDGSGSTSDVIAAADWILQHKNEYNIRVANFSLTSSGDSSVLYDPLDKAVERLWLAGVVVVAAAGNYGTGGTPSGVHTAPGNDPFVITVGASDINGTVDPSDDFAAPWSAYGYTNDGFMKPELSAPGRYMVAPVPAGATMLAEAPDRQVAPGYMWMSGTSFAAPVVAGAAARILAAHPGYTPDQVKGALMWSAAAASPLTPQYSLGVGVLQADSAAAVVDPPNPNAALDQFVASDPSTGAPSFDAASWASAAQANASWASASWASASWASASWASASWASASWASASWASASWASASWASASWASASWASASWASASWASATFVS